VFRKALGGRLAPNLAIRSGGRLYTGGNTLEADQQAGGSLGLEAVNKQGALIASSVEWVGVSGTGSRASVSRERAVRQAVVLKANGEEVCITVQVKVFVGAPLQAALTTQGGGRINGRLRNCAQACHSQPALMALPGARRDLQHERFRLNSLKYSFSGCPPFSFLPGRDRSSTHPGHPTMRLPAQKTEVIALLRQLSHARHAGKGTAEFTLGIPRH
jgi:hypothetical protein